MSKIRILIGDGIGGQLQGFSCADIVQSQGHEVHIGIFARNEIFNFLKEIFKDKFKNIVQLPESFIEDYQIEKNPDLWTKLNEGFDEAYLIIPDLLYRNPHKFNYKRFNINLSQIKNHKLLTDRYNPQQNLCILNLLSVTNGYTYNYISDLINFLCLQNPKWKFIFPNNIIWNNIKIHIDIKNKYPNLIIEENPTLLKWFEWMTKANFSISTDCGMMHVANHLNIEQLILDPQFNRLAFYARWRTSGDDSIPISTSAIDVAKLTKNLLDNELTRLLPKKLLLDRLLQGDIRWEQELIYKF
jgi:hypothetical protein